MYSSNINFLSPTEKQASMTKPDETFLSQKLEQQYEQPLKPSFVLKWWLTLWLRSVFKWWKGRILQAFPRKLCSTVTRQHIGYTDSCNHIAKKLPKELSTAGDLIPSNTLSVECENDLAERTQRHRQRLEKVISFFSARGEMSGAWFAWLISFSSPMSLTHSLLQDQLGVFKDIEIDFWIWKLI